MDDLLNAKTILEQYKMAVDESMIVSKTSTNGIITYVNDLFCEVSKYPIEELVGKNHNIIRHPDMPRETFKDLWKTIQSKKIWKGIVKNQAKDNSTYYVDTVIIPIVDSNDQIIEYIGLRNDITKLLESEKLLEKARIDELTNLKSRAALLEDLENRKDEILTLAVLDIKSFKDINDFYGHKVGDELLQIIARELREFLKDNCKSNCELYRIPIDIFAILSNANIEDMQERLEEFVRYLATKPINILDSHIYINATVGLSNSKNGKELYQNSDIALQYAKSHKIPSQIYNCELNLQKEIENNLQWTQRLNEAIYDEKVKAFYQPIINNKTLKCEKYESLVRLIDENENVISPFYFLDISKQTKLYSYLTKIVLEQSLETFKNNDFSFTINLSVEDFENERTVALLMECLKDSNIAKRVVLEITESEEVKNFNKTTSLITKFKNLGCKIAIDDFGSGYSNFNYLMQLQADIIKIDGSLIKNLDNDYASQSIVKAIVSFAKEMGIKTVAEYVHSKDVYDKVCQYGIDYSQGFYFGIPSDSLELQPAKD